VELRETVICSGTEGGAPGEDGPWRYLAYR